jgi:16S rRNA (cytosine967-C5)-methyltransferase
MEQAQASAAKAVARVLAGTALPAALESASEPRAPGRALVQELAYGTLRFLGEAREILRLLAERPLPDRDLEALLWVALYQLAHTGAPAHAVVDNAVRAAARLRKASARGLVNAVLRQFLRRRDALLAAAAHGPEGRFSYPRWWIARIEQQYAEQAASILEAGNSRPPLCLRVNARRIARGDYLAALAANGIAAAPAGAAGVIVEKPRPTSELPGYAEGCFAVQDAGAQLAAPLIDAREGMHVLDACAAPGGKTTHLAELARLDLLALDRDPQRLARVGENLARLGLAARLAVADAGDPERWWDGRLFHRILLDVPCTASGVVRRHPDIKWLRRESDIAAFVAQQRRLLDALWPLLARGGLLLYATCSVFRPENEDQIAAFAARHADAAALRLALPESLGMRGGQLLPSAGAAEHNHDGFFYALLHKN